MIVEAFPWNIKSIPEFWDLELLLIFTIPYLLHSALLAGHALSLGRPIAKVAASSQLADFLSSAFWTILKTVYWTYVVQALVGLVFFLLLIRRQVACEDRISALKVCIFEVNILDRRCTEYNVWPLTDLFHAADSGCNPQHER